MKIKTVITVSLVATILASCVPATKVIPTGTAISPTIELELNRQKWQSQNITHYRFDLEVSCMCGFLHKMPFTIEIKNGEAISIVNNSGETISIKDNPNASPENLDYYAPYISFDKIFTQAQNTISKGAEFKGEYDKKLGFPTWMCFDNCEPHDPIIYDGTLSLTITNFETLP